MTLAGLFHDLVFDYTLRNVALGAGVLGLLSGALGAFAVLRRQSLLGDTVAHAALPGVAMAFLLTGTRSPLPLLLGAALAGWLGALLALGITRTTRLKSDSAFGVVLSVFFGLGLVLLTWIQKQPNAQQAGLETFLFGQASALLARDVAVMSAATAVLLGVVLLFFKEFKLAAFDPEFGISLGFRMRAIDVTLTSALVVAIVLGLQTVGVVLMSALIVAPAAAARQWTDSLGRMVALSGLFGAIGGVAGAVLSSLAPRVPTGPVIVLCTAVIVTLSFLLAPARGLCWRGVRHLGHRRRLAVDSVLLDLLELGRQHPSPDHPHRREALESMSLRPGSVARTLVELGQRGWVREEADGSWALTPAGHQQAEARRLGGEARP